MLDASPTDPYQLTPDAVQQPPRTLGRIVRRIGPGLILANAIVGSGELVATTVLGAENGYTLLWLILVSCVVKTVVQGELGRYTVGTGETALEAFDRIPGPRFRVSWVVWLWFLMIVATLLTIGAMLGAIGEVMQLLVPAVSINAWVWIICVGTVILLTAGRYELVEKVSVGLVVSFTALTVSSAFLLGSRPEYFSWASVVDGLSFHLPEGGLLTAVAVFGITGVGATELAMYPYWCIEKGYARFSGPPDGSPAWRSRAGGWINVMGVDILSSMAIYTFATVAFYLLGAGVLHGMGVMPQGTEMVKALSNMYTETLGGWSHGLFLIGSVVVFYSTVFAATAGHSRMLADLVGMLGVFHKRNYGARLKATRFFVATYLIVPAFCYMFMREPVLMVKIGGAAEASLLPVIAFSTIYLRYRHLPAGVVPKGWITLALWVTSTIMLFMMGYSLLVQFG